MGNNSSLLTRLAVRMRNRIAASRGAVYFQNIHNAGNEITVEGANSSLCFEGAEGYLRSGRVVIKGNGDIVMIGNGSMLVDGCSIRVLGNNNTIIIGEDCKLNSLSIYILGNDNTITIGSKVSSVFTSISIERDNNRVFIDDGTTMHGRNNGLIELTLDEATNISIGKDCMISNDICFRSSDSHSVLNQEGKRINPAKDIVVKDHVWIGMRAMILKGTMIMNDCIIGAGSVCNKYYKKESCLIAGNPAKVVKENVNWSRDRL